jgi:hypothetical protein
LIYLERQKYSFFQENRLFQESGVIAIRPSENFKISDEVCWAGEAIPLFESFIAELKAINLPLRIKNILKFENLTI